jgi:cell division septum initiation protein DivIVA
VDLDDWETRNSRYFTEDSAPGSSSNRIDRLRDDLYQQSLARVSAREKLSERIVSVERSCHGLADKTASLEKMVVVAREYAKKAHEVAKTTSVLLGSHQTAFDQLSVRVGGLEHQVEGIKHVTVKSVEHDRRLTELQTRSNSC